MANPPNDLFERAFASVRTAVARYRAGDPETVACVFCAGAIGVEGMPRDAPTQWLVHCPCGKSNTTIKGL